MKILEMLFGILMFAGLGLLLWLCLFGVVI